MRHLAWYWKALMCLGPSILLLIVVIARTYILDFIARKKIVKSGNKNLSFEAVKKMLAEQTKPENKQLNYDQMSRAQRRRIQRKMEGDKKYTTRLKENKMRIIEAKDFLKMNKEDLSKKFFDGK